MIPAIRFGIPLIIILSVIYLYLTIRWRWKANKELQAEFDAGAVKGDRDAYIKEGMKEYEGSFRRKLLLGVFIIPGLAIAGLVYLINF